MYMYIIPTISLFGVPQYIFQPKRSNPSASGKALQVDYDKLRHHPVLPRFFELPQWKVQAPSPLALSLLRCQVTGMGILTMGWWGVKREKWWFHQGKWGVFLWNKWWFHQTKMGLKWQKTWFNHHQKGFNQEQLRFMQWKMDLTMGYGGFNEE